MTARLMDLIVRCHELPKGEIVTKRDEIAAEGDALPVPVCGKHRVWFSSGHDCEICTSRTRLAEREAEIERLNEALTKIEQEPPKMAQYGDSFVLSRCVRTMRGYAQNALAAPRKEPRNV